MRHSRKWAAALGKQTWVMEPTDGLWWLWRPWCNPDWSELTFVSNGKASFNKHTWYSVKSLVSGGPNKKGALWMRTWRPIPELECERADDGVCVVNQPQERGDAKKTKGTK
jgi:hypothetical protein